jgi:hypothetical protein
MMTRRRKKHRPEEVVAKLRDADAMLNVGKDLAAEFQARRVVVDVLGRIRAGRDLAGAGNRDELDVDLHAGLQMSADGECRRRGRETAAGKSAATGARATPADGDFCDH